jgi:hypothetical protein
VAPPRVGGGAMFVREIEMRSVKTTKKNRVKINSPESEERDFVKQLLDLRNRAKARGLKTLQGLLEISYYEAYELANPIQCKSELRLPNEIGKIKKSSFVSAD